VPSANPSPNPQASRRFLLVKTSVCNAPQETFVTTSSVESKIYVVISAVGLGFFGLNFSFIRIIYSIILSIDEDLSFKGD
jgi:hypothetical protein